MQRTPIDLVNAIADNNVNFEEHEIKCDVEHSTLIVDKTKQTNDKIVVSENDLKAGIEGITEESHASAPRDMATTLKFCTRRSF